MKKIKKLIQRIKSNSGRTKGLITAPRKSSLIKRLYRFVDHKRDFRAQGMILRMEYDPNRNCKIALLVFTEGFLTYVLPAETNKTGSKITNVKNGIKIFPGDSTKLSVISTGSLVYNLAVSPLGKGQYVRSAGNSAILIKNNGKISLIKLRSGEYRYFFSESLAVHGKVNSSEYFLKDWRLAGKSRRMGIRPRTRALAKNPVDHPMGGRTKGGTPKLTPKGVVCLNTETRLTRNKLVVIKAREKKKI